MKTSNLGKLFASSAILISLAACAEITPTSSNGMRFADGDPQSRADRASPEGTTITLRAVKIDMTGTGPYPYGEGINYSSATTKLVDVIVVGTGSGSDLEDADYVLSIDGDTIEFNSSDVYLGEGDKPEAVISTQGDFYYFYVHEAVEDSLFVLNGYTAETFEEWQNVEFYTVIGLETDPGFLEGKAEATYLGVNYLWVVNDDPELTGGWAIAQGEIEINADFAGATIEGNMIGVLDATFAGIIEGNGWSAGFVTATGYYSFGDGIPNYDVLSVDGQLEGVFYGVDGEHTAGLITTNFIVDGPEFDWEMSGGGYFVACEDLIECGLDVDPVIDPIP